MPVTGEVTDLSSNGLLAALSTDEQNGLRSCLEIVPLIPKHVLCESDERVSHVYFPTSGIVSMRLLMNDGFAAEVGRVGTEGIVGLPVFLGAETSHIGAVVEMPGEALRMTAQDFRRMLNRTERLESILRRYTQVIVDHISQLTACNNRHSIEQRLCRWLLMTQSQLNADQFEVTQESLAQVLGTYRPSVTLAARNLQRGGLIRYSRGKLTILDGDRLESASCECYRAIKRGFDRLIVARNS